MIGEYTEEQRELDEMQAWSLKEDFAFMEKCLEYLANKDALSENDDDNELNGEPLPY